jgi:hypothetical protein
LLGAPSDDPEVDIRDISCRQPLDYVGGGENQADTGGLSTDCLRDVLRRLLDVLAGINSFRDIESYLQHSRSERDALMHHLQRVLSRPSVDLD